ncbi:MULTISPECIES: Wzz/FepE/Etk N-terminal domain-containing protein [unclassified Meiothermus]|uniref:Wzz/FepE/Etk N-terminal domain-containing protein n=1 Tax=unclassified Meiothermus TaxID=370471 RepID=UPI000D7C3A37|nr:MULTISPECIES: Wzz/FepE/Etk N-terminal domain-containing protein [unclassified Meiothermus]PZA06796.1 lipopolysaccharide biosynthesis protein [Meiothermus sp. Pnk-1]RYM33645.1 lipopolysaccharide biosynthesis protein [Meiothermus sp. PNK-Is4]
MNETAQGQDEISLRDLYLVLKRNARTILAVPLGAALVTFAISTILPKTYRSQVNLSLSVTSQQQLSGQILANLPSLSGLAGSFQDLLATRELAQTLGVANPASRYQAKFDDKTGVWKLSAKGSSPEEAKRAAEKLLATARDFLEGRLTQTVNSNLAALLAQARIDAEGAQLGLQEIKKALANTSPTAGADAAVAAALESQGVNPLVARASSPAYASLKLQEANLRSQLAQAQARIETYSRLAQNPQEIRALVGQAIQIQILIPPTEPLRPASPKPLLYAAIAAALGLFLGVFWAFLAEALAPGRPEAEAAHTPPSVKETVRLP